MPLEPETGIYRAPSKKVLSPKAVAARPSKGIIAKWPRATRDNFEREVLARQKPLKQIAKEYGIAYGTAVQWKVTVLQPALQAAQQQDNIEEQSAAREHLSFLFGVNRRIIEALEIEALEDGTEEVNAETGEVTRKHMDPRVTGTIAQNIGQGANLCKNLGEFTGELADVANSRPVENTVIRVISMPKSLGVEVSMQNRQRPMIELAAIPEDEPPAA